MDPTVTRVKRRIQLRLGGWMYLFVAVFIGLAAMNSQTNLLFWTFGLMIGGAIVSTLYSWLMMTGLQITRLLPDHGAVNEPMQIRYVLSNRKWLMPCFGLVISERQGDEFGRLRGRPHGLVMHIPPRAVSQAEAIAWPTRRGPIMLEHIEVGATFPFGIVRIYNVYRQPGRVLVYPAMYRIHRQILRELRSQDISGARISQQGGGTEEFYGLREYRPGDSMKVIDWKHTARLQKLVCREMARLNPPKLMILIDLRNRGEYPFDRSEEAISFASSVLCEAHLDGFEVGIAVVGAACPSFPPGHGRWHRVRILHALAETNLMVSTDHLSVEISNREAFWLVVHATAIDESIGPRGAKHLTVEQFEHWRAQKTPIAQIHAHAESGVSATPARRPIDAKDDANDGDDTHGNSTPDTATDAAADDEREVAAT
ncbi:MAG: DUF58 domain-containing protein [Phycisphaera sp.]|nr:DUF58 domain-containing protein [Phycisphaera sp.]